MAKMDEFLLRYKNPSQSISAILNTETQKVMSNNTMVMESLLKIILLCHMQGPSLRGHRHHHINWIDQSLIMCRFILCVYIPIKLESAYFIEVSE